MRSDARKRLHPEPLTHHDPAVRELIREAQEKAWDEGHRAGGRDEYQFSSAENPYRSAP